MQRYVVSAPRSGLNWTRFCVEYFYGLNTPGKPLYLKKTRGVEMAFRRSHDAMLRTPGKKEGPAYRRIDPAGTAGDRVVLILRDPLESFVRMARKRLRLFASYTGNIQFWDAAVTETKMVAYYDELVARPEKMAELLAFLDLNPAGGRAAPTEDELRARWDEAAEISRNLYHRNQFFGGGAKTRGNPLDFRFHQRRLSDRQKAAVWNHLDEVLTPPQLALIERYRPAR